MAGTSTPKQEPIFSSSRIRVPDCAMTIEERCTFPANHSVIDNAFVAVPPRPGSRPSILRASSRKRCHPGLDDDRQSTSNVHQTNARRFDNAYVEHLTERTKMQRREEAMSNKKQRPPISSHHTDIRKRLQRFGYCDQNRLACSVPMCGRQFSDLSILAYHLSYAHTGVYKKSSSSQFDCLVCGLVGRSVKGKNAHLSSAHRELALNHNKQCVVQRELVMAPGAPAAARIMVQSRAVKRLDNEGISSEYASLLLLDEIGYERDADEIVEDVSVPEPDEFDRRNSDHKPPVPCGRFRPLVMSTKPIDFTVISTERLPENQRPGSVAHEEIIVDVEGDDDDNTRSPPPLLDSYPTTSTDCPSNTE